MQALINKETLKTICETKGVSEEYLSDVCGIKLQDINSYLDVSSPKLPAFGKAKIIAKKLHVPFAGLYMMPADLPIQQIKKIKKRMINFRSRYSSYDDSALNLAIIDLVEARESYKEACDLLGKDIIPCGLIAPAGNSAGDWADAIRNQLGLDLETQCSLKSKRKFFLYLRERIEDKGVFTNSFGGLDVEEVRGIAIADGYPIIGINVKDSFPAKTFSLIHELVHILKGQSGICNEMVDSFSAKEEEEVFCNAVAGELLVPKKALVSKAVELFGDLDVDYSSLELLANTFLVSREVIARRLLDCNQIISGSTYKQWIFQLRKEYDDSIALQKEKAREARENGLPSGFPRHQEREAIDRNSSNYCRTLCEGYYNGVFTRLDLSDSLHIKLKNVDKFIGEVAAWDN